MGPTQGALLSISVCICLSPSCGSREKGDLTKSTYSVKKISNLEEHQHSRTILDRNLNVHRLLLPSSLPPFFSFSLLFFRLSFLISSFCLPSLLSFPHPTFLPSFNLSFFSHTKCWDQYSCAKTKTKTEAAVSRLTSRQGPDEWRGCHNSRGNLTLALSNTINSLSAMGSSTGLNCPQHVLKFSSPAGPRLCQRPASRRAPRASSLVLFCFEHLTCEAMSLQGYNGIPLQKTQWNPLNDWGMFPSRAGNLVWSSLSPSQSLLPVIKICFQGSLLAF